MQGVNDSSYGHIGVYYAEWPEQLRGVRCIFADNPDVSEVHIFTPMPGNHKVEDVFKQEQETVEEHTECQTKEPVAPDPMNFPA